MRLPPLKVMEQWLALFKKWPVKSLDQNAGSPYYDFSWFFSDPPSNVLPHTSSLFGMIFPLDAM